MNRAWRSPSASILLATAFAILLGGPSDAIHALALLSLCGFLALLHPTAKTRSRAFEAISALALLLGAAAFLPYKWFPESPWREALTQDLNHALPPVLTPQPWITLERFITAAGAFAWLHHLRRCPWTNRDRRLALHGLMTLFTLLALLGLILQWKQMPWPWGEAPDQYTPFANRNQFATLCALSLTLHTAALLGTRWTKHHLRRLLFLNIGTITTAVALLVIGSRAGILLAILGVTTLLTHRAWTKRTVRPLAIAISFGFFTLAALFLTEPRILERLTFSHETIEAFQNGRLALYRDTLTLIEHAPILGQGLGNFAGTFPFVRQVSLSEYGIRHPDSDLLWWWAELGPASLLLFIAGILLTISHIRKRHQQPHSAHARPYDRALHRGAIAALALVALHACVDVPLHRLGTVWPALLLLALVTSPKPSRTLPHPRRNLYPAAAAALAILIVTLTPKDPTQRAPLSWQHHFTRAQELLHAGRLHQAETHFQIARFLEPHSPLIPLAEANHWRAIGDPTRTLHAWQEVLRRDPAQAPIYRDRFTKQAKRQALPIPLATLSEDS